MSRCDYAPRWVCLKCREYSTANLSKICSNCLAGARIVTLRRTREYYRASIRQTRKGYKDIMDTDNGRNWRSDPKILHTARLLCKLSVSHISRNQFLARMKELAVMTDDGCPNFD